ncbi:MAG: type II toxin-antitoxin system HicB family antitoxin [Nitrospira sp.]|nr:type II toxin-antitoxin system HicB family antitoxin [Nitrospira sp.]
MRYAVVIERSETGFSAFVLDVPGCVATGSTVEEAKAAIREALEFHLDDMRQDDMPIPQPTSRVDYVEIAA